MPERIFDIVDVFAEAPYTGNQLAVFRDGHLYSDAAMQQLAREMHFSETTFIFPEESHDTTFKVRIFTPAAEVPFAGHPTLGTAYVIAREILQAPVPSVTLDLAAGAIPVAIHYDAAGGISRLTMRQLAPTFGPHLDSARAAAMLGLPPDAIDARYPAEEVSTGLPFLIVPVRDLAAMQAIQVDTARMAAALAPFAADGVLCFCPETLRPENDLHVRVFVPLLGVAEDPATGSGNGCLLAYLLAQRFFDRPRLDLRVEQGFALGRDAILELSGAIEDGQYRIEVGGQVQPVAQGRMR